MKNIFRDLVRLFYPPMCAVCEKPLPPGAGFICSRCQWEIPLTGFWKQVDNPVIKKFHGHLPLQQASSFFYFVHESDYRGLIHKFKYRGGWGLARRMGYWFGAELAKSGLYDSVDIIVPIPLHFRRLLKRGYNQSEYIARGISAAMSKSMSNSMSNSMSKPMSKPMVSGAVVRSRYNRSQTSRSHKERWENVKGIFSVRRPEKLAGKHILLVDDVLTTGATLISCAEAILSAVPDAHISIVTLAVSRGES